MKGNEMTLMSRYSKEYSRRYEKVFKKCVNCGEPASVRICGEYLCVDCADAVTDGCTSEIIEESDENEFMSFIGKLYERFYDRK